MSYQSNFDTCLTLWALVCCGILTVVSSRDAESLFREQVAEFELTEIRDRVEAVNAALRATCDRLATEVGADRLRALLEGAFADVIDQHYDVLREVDLTTREVEPDLVVENVQAVDAGERKQLVEAALDDVVVALLLRVRLSVSPELERELAAEVSRLRS
jgi:hypothetical protein